MLRIRVAKEGNLLRQHRCDSFGYLRPKVNVNRECLTLSSHTRRLSSGFADTSLKSVFKRLKTGLSSFSSCWTSPFRDSLRNTLADSRGNLPLLLQIFLTPSFSRHTRSLRRPFSSVCERSIHHGDGHFVKRPPSKEEVASVTIQAGFRAMKAREEATRRRYSRDDDDNAVAKVVKDEIGEDEDNAAAKATSG
ncbi:unnamed protein product [Vitrella brassicaformis CCMP3155]|uniref:Uncharacterized protein n=1 Tax=Vitrella brassicaformis (strain CCMP3155) TaxID=1169540 RepID=A0A0G4ETY5_VITBC|nr:unnamed protein product [Vitrella brassicaformis CCMP3155]|eukprot:CEM01844.1 unnamed protein product [Vitrella brassicaformis CCMP3155]